jgi:hypothetical protein
VLLSVRDTAEEWWHSVDAVILQSARQALAPDRNGGRGFLALLERFTGTVRWDDPRTILAAYQRHNTEVQRTVPAPDCWSSAPPRNGHRSVTRWGCPYPRIRSLGSTRE